MLECLGSRSAECLLPSPEGLLSASAWHTACQAGVVGWLILHRHPLILEKPEIVWALQIRGVVSWGSESTCRSEVQVAFAFRLPPMCWRSH